jgi:hypothetical protein
VTGEEKQRRPRVLTLKHPSHSSPQPTAQQTTAQHSPPLAVLKHTRPSSSAAPTGEFAECKCKYGKAGQRDTHRDERTPAAARAVSCLSNRTACCAKDAGRSEPENTREQEATALHTYAPRRPAPSNHHTAQHSTPQHATQHTSLPTHLHTGRAPGWQPPARHPACQLQSTLTTVHCATLSPCTYRYCINTFSPVRIQCRSAVCWGTLSHASGHHYTRPPPARHS